MKSRALVAGASLRSHADQLSPGQTRWSAPLAPPVPKPALLNALARAFLDGEPAVEQLVQRAARTLGREWRWLRPVANRYAAEFAGKVRPTPRSVIAFLRNDDTVHRAWLQRASQLKIATWISSTGGMQPVAAAADWPLPVIESIGELAQWLSIPVAELEWFADLRGFAARSHTPQLRHYHSRILAKPSGNLRLIEAPKQRLKAIQRRILHQILEPVPIHSAVHGFVKGRSARTFASMHVGKRVVLRMDLREFFPSIPRSRVQAIYRTMGYPPSVAGLLGGLCTSVTARSIWKTVTSNALPSINRNVVLEASQRYARSHLPQGAPTSPTLANLCAFRLDCRLNGLAQAAGATYTRYADDLAFSGDAAFERSVNRLAITVAAIAAEEGWEINHRKTRIMRQGVRQHLVGLVTNQHVNVMRADADRLKATLTNCIRHGASTQNRSNHPQFQMHLEGRISFVESINAARGKRLRDLFDQIAW